MKRLSRSPVEGARGLAPGHFSKAAGDRSPGSGAGLAGRNSCTLSAGAAEASAERPRHQGPGSKTTWIVSFNATEKIQIPSSLSASLPNPHAGPCSTHGVLSLRAAVKWGLGLFCSAPE